MKERLPHALIFVFIPYFAGAICQVCVCVSARVCLMVRGNDHVEGRDSNHVHTAYSVL